MENFLFFLCFSSCTDLLVYILFFLLTIVLFVIVLFFFLAILVKYVMVGDCGVIMAYMTMTR